MCTAEFLNLFKLSAPQLVINLDHFGKCSVQERGAIVDHACGIIKQHARSRLFYSYLTSFTLKEVEGAITFKEIPLDRLDLRNPVFLQHFIINKFTGLWQYGEHTKLRNATLYVFCS